MYFEGRMELELEIGDNTYAADTVYRVDYFDEQWNERGKHIISVDLNVNSLVALRAFVTDYHGPLDGLKGLVEKATAELRKPYNVERIRESVVDKLGEMCYN